jgi:hypothetical protein
MPLLLESCEYNKKGEDKDRNNCPKYNASLKGFLFTLKNLPDVVAKLFSLRVDRNEYEIQCYSE